MTTTAARRLALLAFIVTFVVLIANGRAIGSGDTNAVEKTAASLAQTGSFVLPSGEPLDPFTRATPGGRISIYPALTAILATPFFWIFGLFFDLNPAGIQVAGKLTAAFFSALATAVMARAFARRTAPLTAFAGAMIFGLGTTVYSTAQALWQHPAVLLFMAIGVSALERVISLPLAERLRPGLLAAASFSLAAAARPACIPMCAVLFVFLMKQSPKEAGRFMAAALVPALAVVAYNQSFFGAPWRFGQSLGGRFFEAFPESLGGLLISPARGLFVFTPVALMALVGLVRAARSSNLARALLASVGAHLLFIAAWNEWHGGESFGPRLLTDLMPSLFFFLPEALSAWPVAGAILGVFSIGVQLLGGWTYDYRWERLHQRGRDFDAALWSWSDSPLAFALREGVLVHGAPDVDGRHLRLQSRRVVPFGPHGSTIEAAGTGLTVTGGAFLSNIRLERGARLDDTWILLSHPQDAIAFTMDADGPWTLQVIGKDRTGRGGALVIDTVDASLPVPLNDEFEISVPLNVRAGEDVWVRPQGTAMSVSRVTVKRSGPTS